MGRTLVPTRNLFWFFWANVIFLIGMVGYFLMDGLELIHRNPFNATTTLYIYVILAGLFIVDSVLQLLAIYKMNSTTSRYSAMIASALFDKLGSDTYFLGAFFLATDLTNSNTVWIFNTIGVCSFAVAAAINMIIPGPICLYIWANSLNLLGSLCYVSAIIVTSVPSTQIIAVSGDFIYVIDAILYMICWFYDRKLTRTPGEQISLIAQQ